MRNERNECKTRKRETELIRRSWESFLFLFSNNHLSPKVLTCSSDISNNVKSILINRSSQRKRNDRPTALLVKHREHQASQVSHGGPMQLHEGPLLAVIGPVATSHLTDDHTFGGWGWAWAAVLPQRSRWSHLR